MLNKKFQSSDFFLNYDQDIFFLKIDILKDCFNLCYKVKHIKSLIIKICIELAFIFKLNLLFTLKKKMQQTKYKNFVYIQ